MATTTHQGSCHCGGVTYRAELNLSQPAITCNCSMCMRMGSVLAFIPGTQFELLSGEDLLSDYQFGAKRIHHLFCKTCGIRSFARGELNGQPMMAINLRCVEGVDLDAIETNFYDGASM
ncbi:GFA family protein [Haliangium ochraceum]|uniref:Glutathione-dependent formaldehyde-activating GFA n=1 Tax=Haliangium ochraceum (strain DSM 14365 / JCM 11303 / SMP-2) TaxID=502025 RepID=D0LQ04_HALO1|nr:GFA family protein [Haliangium ochraceum]ACY17041.1 glutathione-dependent formaldehyde-activating GFA [Haliangium ochraceum DSM 14365]